LPGGVDNCKSCLHASGAGGLLFLAVCLTASAGVAAPDAPPRAEYFTGFEVSDNYASGYVGGGFAFGKAGLYEPGFRLRAVGAYGRYRYDGTLLVDGKDLPIEFEGQVAFLAALVGYQFQPGRAILKLFAGIEAEDQHIVPHDPNNSVQGSALGLRLQAESWLDLSEKTVSLRRRNLRHGVSGILVAGPARLSGAPAPFARTRGRRARQRGI
jgi:hypothetical protein